MIAQLFGYELEVSIRKQHNAGHPLDWPKLAQRKLARDISALLGTSVRREDGNLVHFPRNMIGRIKACRYILIERGLEGRLKEAKEFCDMAFDKDGRIVL